MHKILFNLALYIFEMFISFIFISYNYEKKMKKRLYVFLIGAALFMAGAVVFTVFGNEALNLLLFFFIHCLFFKLCFKITYKEAVVYSIILDVVMFSTEMITIFFYSLIFKEETSTYQTSFTAFIILTTISKILYFILSQIIALIINKIKFRVSKSLRFVPLFIFPVLSIAISLIFLKMSFSYSYNDVYNSIFIVLNIFLIIASMYIFVYYQILLKNDEELKEIQIEKQIYEINDSYLRILQHQNDEMRMMVHDTKNHFLTINNMKSISEIKDYISNIIGDMGKYVIVQRTNNRILDILLSKYDVLCKNNNIKFIIEVNTANLDYINDNDLAILVNNLMDNAVEAASKSTEKEIDFSIRCINNFDVLNITNSCDENPVHYGKELYTTKEEKKAHGFGTKIIKKYAKKNNAQYEWSYNKEILKFSSTLIFSK